MVQEPALLARLQAAFRRDLPSKARDGGARRLSAQAAHTLAVQTLMVAAGVRAGHLVDTFSPTPSDARAAARVLAENLPDALSARLRLLLVSPGHLFIAKHASLVALNEADQHVVNVSLRALPLTLQALGSDGPSAQLIAAVQAYFAAGNAGEIGCFAIGPADEAAAERFRRAGIALAGRLLGYGVAYDLSVPGDVADLPVRIGPLGPGEDAFASDAESFQEPAPNVLGGQDLMLIRSALILGDRWVADLAAFTVPCSCAGSPDELRRNMLDRTDDGAARRAIAETIATLREQSTADEDLISWLSALRVKQTVTIVNEPQIAL